MINASRVTDIFFDLDHTLWDFEKNSALTFKLIFSKLNFKVEIDDFLAYYNPINQKCWSLYRQNKISQKELRLQRLIQTFNALDMQINKDDLEEISNQYIENLCKFSHLFEGANDLLKFLKKKYRLHIITNGFDRVQNFKIKNSGLQPFFNSVFTAEKVGFKKPHHKIFETAMKVVGSTPYSSLMIGDSFEADILGALKLGMQALHFNSHNEPEHNRCTTVNSLKDIQQIFE